MRKLIFVGLSFLALNAGTAIAQAPASQTPASQATSATAAPSTAQPVDLAIGGPSLRVTDLERSVKFYTEGLGLEVSRRLRAGAGSRAILVAPGKGNSPFLNLFQDVADASKSAPIVQGTGFQRIFFSAANSAAVGARLKAAGYAVRSGSAGIFFVDDPDGYHVEIVPRQPAPPR